MKKIFIVLLMAVTLSACTGGGELATFKEENEQLKEKVATLEKTNSALTVELEEFKFGAPKLLEEIKAKFTSKDYAKVKELSKTLTEKHPTSAEVKEANAVLAEITKIEDQAKAAKDAEEKKKAEELKKAQEEEKKRLAAAVSKMRKTNDEVTGVTWYYDKSTTEYVDTKAFYVYIAQKDDLVALRLKIQYSGDNWVFIDSYTIKTDSNSYDILPDYDDVKRDNGYGGVWEWYDEQATDADIAMIQDIISSKKTIIRHEGSQNQYDRTVTDAEKKALQNVLDAYQALGGKIGKTA